MCSESLKKMSQVKDLRLLNNIPLDHDIDQWLRDLEVGDKVRAREENMLKRVIEQATNLIDPKAVFVVAYVEDRTDDTVTLGATVFESSVLRKNLDQVERVFPYIITVGSELEKKAGSMDDPLEQYYLEAMADLALQKTQEYLESYLQETYRLGQISTMSPGSLSNWPLEQQRELFSLLGDPKKNVGVHLTESFLMIPRKSISGIYFPTQVKFHSCQLCPRKQCIGRKAPYNPELAREMIPPAEK